MPAKFTVYKDRAGKYRFNLKASNGDIIIASESYPEKKLTMKSLALVVKNASKAKIEDTTVEVNEIKKKRGRPPADSKKDNKPAK